MQKVLLITPLTPMLSMVLEKWRTSLVLNENKVRSFYFIAVFLVREQPREQECELITLLWKVKK